ncbi:MAG: hypothetical protein AN485_23920, partial [Anabaena sp. MDT14b]
PKWNFRAWNKEGALQYLLKRFDPGAHGMRVITQARQILGNTRKFFLRDRHLSYSFVPMSGHVQDIATGATHDHWQNAPVGPAGRPTNAKDLQWG